MNIDISLDSELPLYLQIKKEIKEQILSGELKAGDRLPATRDLARQLGVNRSTVTNAYDELLAEGVLNSHVGQGTFVSENVGVYLQEAGDRSQKMVWDGLFAGEAEALSVLRDLYQVSTLADVVSFSSLFPDERSFPIDEFKASLSYALRRFGTKVLRYENTAGLQVFREYMATELSRRGVAAQPENILITNGSQQTIDLLARAFIAEGDTVIVENPTYPGAINAFAMQGARLIGIPLDSDGIQIGSLEQIIERQRPKLIYLIPTFHNPTGLSLSLERRHRLMALARKYRIPVLEDAYGEDLRFYGDALPSLKSLDITEQVVYFGSFSKSFLPGLRIGWCLAPGPVFSRLIALKQVSDMTTSPLTQAALWDFCRRRRYQAHLERIRDIYRKRRDVLLNGLKRYFPEGTIWNEPDGGLFCWVTLPEQIDATELQVESRQRGVVFARGQLFHVYGGGRNTLRLGFGNLSEEEIEFGLKTIGKVAHELLSISEYDPNAFLRNTLPLV